MVTRTVLFHVMFDHQPTVRCHVCPEHRAFADALPCPDHDDQGVCDHIQYAECDCVYPLVCGDCFTEFAVASVGCIGCRNQTF